MQVMNLGGSFVATDTTGDDEMVASVLTMTDEGPVVQKIKSKKNLVLDAIFSHQAEDQVVELVKTSEPEFLTEPHPAFGIGVIDMFVQEGLAQVSRAFFERIRGEGLTIDQASLGRALIRAISDGNMSIAEDIVPSVDLLLANDYGNTVLHLAAADGKLEVVKFVCEKLPQEKLQKVKVSKNGEQLTPFHLVCAALVKNDSSVDLLKLLFESSLIDDPQNEMNCSPLMLAIFSFDDVTDLVSTLLDLGANIELPIPEGPNAGMTPLMMALQLRKPITARFLIDKGAEITPTCLHLAARQKIPELISYFLDQNPDFSVVDKNGETALQALVGRMNPLRKKPLSREEQHYRQFDDPSQDFIRDYKLCEDATSASLDLALPALLKGCSLKGSLGAACRSYHCTERMIIALLEAGADAKEGCPLADLFSTRVMNAPYMFEGWKELVHVSRFTKIAKMLVDAGADVKAVDEDSCTALHYIGSNSPEFVGESAPLFAKVINAKDRDGLTPLHMAVSWTCSLPECLTSLNPDWTTVDNEGHSILHTLLTQHDENFVVLAEILKKAPSLVNDEIISVARDTEKAIFTKDVNLSVALGIEVEIFSDFFGEALTLAKKGYVPPSMSELPEGEETPFSEVLLTYLDPESLSRLGSTCRHLHQLVAVDRIWGSYKEEGLDARQSRIRQTISKKNILGKGAVSYTHYFMGESDSVTLVGNRLVSWLGKQVKVRDLSGNELWSGTSTTDVSPKECAVFGDYMLLYEPYGVAVALAKLEEDNSVKVLHEYAVSSPEYIGACKILENEIVIATAKKIRVFSMDLIPTGEEYDGEVYGMDASKDLIVTGTGFQGDLKVRLYDRKQRLQVGAFEGMKEPTRFVRIIDCEHIICGGGRQVALFNLNGLVHVDKEHIGLSMSGIEPSDVHPPTVFVSYAGADCFLRRVEDGKVIHKFCVGDSEGWHSAAANVPSVVVLEEEGVVLVAKNQAGSRVHAYSIETGQELYAVKTTLVSPSLWLDKKSWAVYLVSRQGLARIDFLRV